MCLRIICATLFRSSVWLRFIMRLPEQNGSASSFVPAREPSPSGENVET
jgi:hypothetical protein